MIKNKKKDNKMKEPTELDLRLEEGKIRFSLFGEEYFIEQAKAVELLQPGPVVLTKQKAEAKDSFEDFNSEHFRAKYEVCYEHFRVIPVVATFLKVNATRLRAWLNDPVSREMWRVKAWGDNPEEGEPLKIGLTGYEDLKEKYQKEFFPPEKKEEKRTYSVDLRKIAKMLQEGMKPRDIAERLEVPWDSFGVGYMKHIKSIGSLASQSGDHGGEHNVRF